MAYNNINERSITSYNLNDEEEGKPHYHTYSLKAQGNFQKSCIHASEITKIIKFEQNQKFSNCRI